MCGLRQREPFRHALGYAGIPSVPEAPGALRSMASRLRRELIGAVTS